MKKKLQKPESVHLKVLKGGGQGLEEAPHFGKNPLFFFLLFSPFFTGSNFSRMVLGIF